MDSDLERRALEFYAQQVREGSDNLYYHYRFYEKHFLLPGLPDGDELVRTAILRIFGSDPYAYAGTYPFDIGLLSEEDIEQISAGITFGGDEQAIRVLRGKLWADAVGNREDPEPFIRRALRELEAISKFDRSPDTWRALAECYRRVDYERFKETVPELLAARDPKWRASELIGALAETGRREDWPMYSAWRSEWDALPQNAHLCDCYLNELETLDGLLALHEGDAATAVNHLKAATEVRGCAHLNSGAADEKLVSALLDHPEFAAECEAYLDFCDRMAGKEVRAELRVRLRR